MASGGLAWGPSAKYLKKGSLLSVEGPIRSRKLTDQDGIERYASEVIANEVLVLGRAERQKQQDASPPVGRDDKPVLSRAQVRAPGMGANRPLHLSPPLMRRHEGNSAGAHFRTQKQPDPRRFRDGSQTPKIRFWDRHHCFRGAPEALHPRRGGLSRGGNSIPRSSRTRRPPLRAARSPRSESPQQAARWRSCGALYFRIRYGRSSPEERNRAAPAPAGPRRSPRAAPGCRSVPARGRTSLDPANGYAVVGQNTSRAEFRRRM